MKLLYWLVWFTLIPAGSLLIFGGIVFLWAGTVVITRRRRWAVTLALSLVFVIVETVLIYKFTYLAVPR